MSFHPLEGEKGFSEPPQPSTYTGPSTFTGATTFTGSTAGSNVYANAEDSDGLTPPDMQPQNLPQQDMQQQNNMPQQSVQEQQNMYRNALRQHGIEPTPLSGT